jgi:hypothetical protein
MLPILFGSHYSSFYIIILGIGVGVVGNLEKGGEAATPSFIKEIQEVHRGQEVPHNGGVIIPKNA